jgi:hypothetical protein
MLLQRLLDTSPRQWASYLVGRHAKAALRRLDEIDPAVFVLSTGRVGTKTLSELAALAPGVVAHHEPQPTLYGLSRAAYSTPTDGCDDILREAFTALRGQLLQLSIARGCGYIETSPQLTFLAPAILAAIPNARFLHVVRHPADVVRSGMRRKWYRGHFSDPKRITPRPGDEHAEGWSQYDAFQKNLWLWSATNTWIGDFFAALPECQRLLVRAEALFSGNTEEMKNFYRFLDSELPSDRKISAVLERKSNAQKKGDFPRAPEWSDQMRQEGERICGRAARNLGYDFSSD